MTVIKEKTLREYGNRYPDAQDSLLAWTKIIKKHQFMHISELREVFPTADAVGKNKSLICFNIKGNKYRLIARITYPKTVFIRGFLTHREYSEKYKF